LKYIKYLFTFRYIKLLSYWSARYLHNKMKEYYKKEHDTDKPKKIYNRYTYHYGFQILYGGLNKFLLLITLGILLNILPQLLLTTISFASLRFWTGGLHYDSYAKCSYISLLSFTLIALLSKYIILNQFISMLIFLSVYFLILIYAPIEHPNKLIKENKKLRFKIIALFMLTILTIIYMFINNTIISNSIVYGILLVGLISTPFANKLK